MVDKVAAFTNAIGNHDKHQMAYLRHWGSYGRDKVSFGPETVASDNVKVARSEKPPHNLAGTHQQARNYSRSAYVVERNTPYLEHSKETYVPTWPVDSDENNVHVAEGFRERLISTNHGPFNFQPDDSGYRENAINESIVKAMNNLAELKVQLGADLGEAEQTISMLSNTVSQLARAMIAGKHGRWSEIPDILEISKKDLLSGKSLSNRWLEYQYGWKPLKSSLYDMQKKLHEDIANGTWLRALGSANWSQSGGFPYGGADWKWSTSGTVQTVVLAHVSNATLHSMNSWGLLNPLQIAWELTPFSFAIDWFVPIGNTLDALTAGVGLDPWGGWTSVHQSASVTAQMKVTEKQHPKTFSIIETPGDYAEKHYHFGRIARTGWPTIRPYADTAPFFKKDKDGNTKFPTRLANAAALLRQLL